MDIRAGSPDAIIKVGRVSCQPRRQRARPLKRAGKGENPVCGTAAGDFIAGDIIKVEMMLSGR
jgi:hypothetical protein